MLTLALACGLACASYKPVPMEDVPFLERAQTQERNGVTVTAAVLSNDESRRLFGVGLPKKRIQPVWIDITNDSPHPYAMLMHSVDPAYFSAGEAAYKSRFRFRPVTNTRVEDQFRAVELDPLVEPDGGHTSGFVFTNLKLGTKEVRVRLFGPGRLEDFAFYVPVPGLRLDYEDVDWENLYSPEEVVDFTSSEDLRKALLELPCCTTRPTGFGEGDPLNFVIVGEGEEVGNALIRAGWDETERLTAGSAWKTFKAFFGGEYKTSPMSSLYVYGRGQDAGFQKARDTIHERNHLRVWASPWTYEGTTVWVGSITRDIGVYFTTRTWNLTTHAIDPFVDEARTYLLEDLLTTGSVDIFGFIEGIEPSTPEDPHRNLMNAPWWTDGLRLVLGVSMQPTEIEDVEFLYWNWGDDDEAINIRLKQLKEDARQK